MRKLLLTTVAPWTASASCEPRTGVPITAPKLIAQAQNCLSMRHARRWLHEEHNYRRAGFSRGHD